MTRHEPTEKARESSGLEEIQRNQNSQHEAYYAETKIRRKTAYTTQWCPRPSAKCPDEVKKNRTNERDETRNETPPPFKK